jgi:Tfp pilus assembly protein FimT
MSIKSNRRAGFSLIELLFFVVLATIVVVAGVTLATNFMRTVAFLTNTVETTLAAKFDSATRFRMRQRTA